MEGIEKSWLKGGSVSRTWLMKASWHENETLIIHTWQSRAAERQKVEKMK
jgi:hypothetical protein